MTLVSRYSNKCIGVCEIIANSSVDAIRRKYLNKEMNKILTISIAAYNVEKFLGQTLASLNDGRFLDDIEVLIVDDGSKDRTRNIALDYQNIAPNTFRYIAKENGGHGSTINKGIDLATGKYFRVLDGDDWIDTEAFAQYIQNLKKADADLVLTPHKVNCNGKEQIKINVSEMSEGRTYTWSDEFDIRLITLHMLAIRTELLRENGIRITEKCFYVDIEYVAWSIYLAHTIAYYNLPVYIYRIGNAEQSVSIKNMIKNLEMQETVSYKLIRLYNQFDKSGQLADKQKQVLFRRISISLGCTVRTYLMLPTTRESREKIFAFEKLTQEISPDLYGKLSVKRIYRMLRLHNYAFIPLLRVLYRIRYAGRL